MHIKFLWNKYLYWRYLSQKKLRFTNIIQLSWENLIPNLSPTNCYYLRNSFLGNKWKDFTYFRKDILTFMDFKSDIRVKFLKIRFLKLSCLLFHQVFVSLDVKSIILSIFNVKSPNNHLWCSWIILVRIYVKVWHIWNTIRSI